MLQKFTVAAVHFAGPESEEENMEFSLLDSPGFALLFSGVDWLQQTVLFAHNLSADVMYGPPHRLCGENPEFV